jgi:hypothetical protein
VTNEQLLLMVGIPIVFNGIFVLVGIAFFEAKFKKRRSGFDKASRMNAAEAPGAGLS